MMVMTTVLGPGAASCARTSAEPLTPTTARSTAIQRVMCLTSSKIPYSVPRSGPKQSGRSVINHSYVRATFSPRHGRIAVCAFWTMPASAVRPPAAYLVLLDDALVRHAASRIASPKCSIIGDEVEMAGQPDHSRCEPAERGRFEAPPEVSSNDP